MKTGWTGLTPRPATQCKIERSRHAREMASNRKKHQPRMKKPLPSKGLREISQLAANHYFRCDWAKNGG